MIGSTASYGNQVETFCSEVDLGHLALQVVVVVVVEGGGVVDVDALTFPGNVSVGFDLDVPPQQL